MRTANPISYPTTNSSRHPYTPPPQCNQSTQTHVSFKLKRHSDHQAFRWFKRKKVMRGSSVLEGVGAPDNLLNSHRKLLPPPPLRKPLLQCKCLDLHMEVTIHAVVVQTKSYGLLDK